MAYNLSWTICGLVGLLVLSQGKYKALQKTLYLLLLFAIFNGFLISTPSSAYEGAPFKNFASGDIIMHACGQIISKTKVCDEKAISSRRSTLEECLCKNRAALASMSYCVNIGYPTQVDAFIDTCNRNTNTSLTRRDFSSALDYYLENNNSNTILSNDGVPIISTLSIYTNRDSYDQFLGNYNRSVEYGVPIVLFWVVVFTLAAIGNWIKLLFPNLCRCFTGPLSTKIRTLITLPALTGEKRTKEMRFGGILDFLQPTRAEFLILNSFGLLIAFLSFHKIHSVENDPVFPNKTTALLRYYSVRAGILATHIVPFAFLFAGRNNFLQVLTKWEHSTFVMFHRWISRIIVILLLVHSIGYGLIIHQSDTARETYIYFGIAGTYAGIAILVQGLLLLRRKFYEAFLLLHILLAAGFVLGAWQHVKDLRFLWFYHLSLWVWISDRAIRIHKVISFGFPFAKVYLFKDSTLKVVVPMAQGFRLVAGGHCFVHFLLPFSFWQSHPFTYTHVDGDIIFYIKVKDGITRTLEKAIISSDLDFMQVRVGVEGSYGEPTPANEYNSRVFIAGGNGIPGIYSEAVYDCTRSPHQRTQLIWIIRDLCSIEWFLKELEALKNLPIETTIYVTKTNETSPLLPSHDQELLLKNKQLAHIIWRTGRPVLSKIVQMATYESPGSICFVTCGQPEMVDTIRHEVVGMISQTPNRIDYFEQLQVWA